MGREIAIVEPNGSTAVAPTQAVQMGTLRADSPQAIIEAATAIATPLAELIHSRGLAKRISGRDYVVCEGWTTLAVMLGVTPHEVGVVEQDGVYTATVELRTMSDGKSIARASAECGADDEVWGKRARYARRSMALTRATGKACRMAFSWIMILAGYAATPAEEMEEVEYSPVTQRNPERAAAGDIDIIRQLLPGAPISEKKLQETEAWITQGITPEDAEKCIEWLRKLIGKAQAEKDGTEDDRPRTAKGNKALEAAAKRYRAALTEFADHLILDDDARDAFEVEVVGRPSRRDWLVADFDKAIEALEAGKARLPDEGDEAA